LYNIQSWDITKKLITIRKLLGRVELKRTPQRVQANTCVAHVPFRTACNTETRARE